MQSKKILFIVNVDWFFVSHRLPIALEALKNNFEVHLATVVTDKEDFLRENGIIVHSLKLSRDKLNPVESINTFIKILKLIFSIKPDIVHAITIKPIVFSGIILRFFPKIPLVLSFAGLGHVVSSENIVNRLRSFIINNLYCFCLKKRKLKVIVQNDDDLRKIRNISGVPLNKTLLIPGSGIDLNKYKATKIPNGKPIILFASRLLISKGIQYFVEASKKVPEAKFIIAGKLDIDNPACISSEEIQNWTNLENVEYLGFKNNVKNIILKSSIIVLPSFYGEGLPKILIEAAACGRPIITTDHPGCKDAIISEKTGILVPIKNINAIVKAIKRLIKSRDLLKKMGESGRIFAEKNFDLNDVVIKHLYVYSGLLNTKD